ncbi:unnamed protein product [Fusarium graminearum]|uniref:Uncharacterized protein n=1 Tax=Gibberella zeae TaxID=5518 RepID=A0A4U9EPT6_GIBZA|nr:unnamed protein product [Fusarium graminearum]CAG1960390.1 unnamed protein product [Fusarium graminearum]CAG1992386.1 unnamed protein product [Fusarium graminearum]VTO85158.1 unnamed protein product [Fusarium graminearum]
MHRFFNYSISTEIKRLMGRCCPGKKRVLQKASCHLDTGPTAGTPDGAGQLQVACSSKWTIPSQKGPQFSQSPNFYTFY